MYLIKPCPACKQKLRFPIDKGKIRIRCSCGNAFIVDPDDPAIYSQASFDLKARERAGLFSLIGTLRNYSFREAGITLINRMLDLMYRIQNFKLLPDSERRRMMLLFAVIFIIFLIITFIMVFL